MFKLDFFAVYYPAFEIFVDQSDRSGSVKKLFLFEIRVSQRIEFK